MSPQSKREYIETVFLRYKCAHLAEKSRIPDEFCATLGYHRKHAIRLLRKYRRFTQPKPKKRGTPARVLWGKRVVVFVLWTISMVFFRVGSGNLSGVAESLGVGDAFAYLGRCLMNSWSPARFAGELYSTAYTGFYANTIMVAAYWAFAALALALGIWLDHRRNFACKNKPAEVALASAKHRNALYVVLIVFILVGYIMQSGGFNANAFGPYAGF